MSEDDDPEMLLLFSTPEPTRTRHEISSGESQILESLKDVRYIVREYPAEVVVQKYLQGKDKGKNEIYVPDYQRELVWSDRNQSRFIESLLIGLPIPFIFVADVSEAEDPENSGKLEIVDGVQRIRTLARFLTNDLSLDKLTRLSRLNGFRFADLHPSRQRRFRRSTLRLIELTENTTEDVRRDMFDRINSGALTLEAVEVRRGMEPGPFLELVTELAADPLLRKLAPISEALQKRFEYEELVTRYFAFVTKYQEYGTGEEGKVVAKFLLTFVREANRDLQKDAKLADLWRKDFKQTLKFVDTYFPDGFKKKGPGRKVPRVRFEAIAAGIGLALKERSSITAKDVSWLESDEFKEWTTSDASNNRANLIGRLLFVRDKLLST